MKIYKYPLQTTDTQNLTVPLGAVFLSLQVQNNEPFIWALVDENESYRKTWFIKTYGTGQPIYNKFNTDIFLGTYQLFDGKLVLHVFGDLS